jgi:hypothetical protein
MSKTTEEQPMAVSERAIRIGEFPGRWSWTEPAVWTERMLKALEQGVKGGKWFSLIDKVHPIRTLEQAFFQVARNDGAAGVDHVTVTMFEEQLDANLKNLSDALRTGTYQPQVIRRHYIPKPGTNEQRPLGIPMRHSYCTSLQRGWGLRRERPDLPWPYLDQEADRRVQDRRAGLRKPAMVSGVNRIHQGPCGVDWRPSRTPDWHQSAIVETVTLSKLAATLAEQRPSAR